MSVACVSADPFQPARREEKTDVHHKMLLSFLPLGSCFLFSQVFFFFLGGGGGGGFLLVMLRFRAIVVTAFCSDML